MLKETIRVAEELKRCTLARCEKYADKSQITALTPIGDEHYNQAVKDFRALTHLISIAKRVEDVEGVKKYLCGFGDTLTCLKINNPHINTPILKGVAQALSSYLKGGEK